MRRLLILRPEPGASATVARARDVGVDAEAVPLFAIEKLAWEPPDAAGFDGLLITSANAIRAGSEQIGKLRGLPVYAVGEATAKAARDAGFAIAATGDSGIERLLGSIDPDLRLLHLCGEERREPVDTKQTITPLAIYRARPLEARDLGSAAGDVALIHSPRAGARFAQLVSERGAIGIAAISEAAAEAAGDGWESVEVADAPNDEALLALAARLCNKPAL